jgi:uncharacterized peroxidase-related enzyme
MIMSRLYTHAVAEATEPAATLFANIRKAAGMVPNAYLTMGSNSPATLESVLHLDAVLRRSSLSAKEIEIVKLVVSEIAACDYCLAAHTLMGKKTGLSRSAILALRHGEPSDDKRNDALASFVRTLATTRGTLPEDRLAAIRSAGFSDAQIVDITLAMAAIHITNLFNRINDTTLDFPAAD